MSNLRFIGPVLAGALLLTSPSQGAEPRITVTFAPAVEANMPTFGDAERGTLKSAVDAAVARATRKVPLPAGVTIQVTFQELTPSHPTRAQIMANPALDPTGTHYLGGAALTGEVRGASGQVLTTVRHRYYPISLRWGSASLDSWSDARLAIDQFAEKLAAACRNLQRS